MKALDTDTRELLRTSLIPRTKSGTSVHYNRPNQHTRGSASVQIRPCQDIPGTKSHEQTRALSRTIRFAVFPSFSMVEGLHYDAGRVAACRRWEGYRGTRPKIPTIPLPTHTILPGSPIWFSQKIPRHTEGAGMPPAGSTMKRPRASNDEGKQAI